MFTHPQEIGGVFLYIIPVVYLATFLINLFFFLTISNWANAVTDPLNTTNNRIGIHILFPDEIETAAKLVNNDNQGSWGYVTIPIQATDRNRERWQKFFDKCTDRKVIPIIRVATVPEGSNWAKPDNYDLIDFANFLGDLRWPTANRYVIIFNEVNRSDEYGGFVRPEDYADILANASDIFKQVSPEFFILPAGLDNAAPNATGYMNHRRYIERMYLHRPDIFEKIDGWTSHAYPNPGFSARPDQSGVNKIDSFKYDLRLIHQFTNKKLPVFITEAGWSSQYLSDIQIGYYYKHALSKIWNDPNIVAITPFLLNAQDGPFTVFSFTKKDGQLKESATIFSSYATTGSPQLSGSTIQITETNIASPESTALPDTKQTTSIFSVFKTIGTLSSIFTSLFGIYKR